MRTLALCAVALSTVIFTPAASAKTGDPRVCTVDGQPQRNLYCAQNAARKAMAAKVATLHQPHVGLLQTSCNPVTPVWLAWKCGEGDSVGNGWGGIVRFLHTKTGWKITVVITKHVTAG